MESIRQHSPPAPLSGAVLRTYRSPRVLPSGPFPSTRPSRSEESSLAPALLQLHEQSTLYCSPLAVDHYSTQGAGQGRRTKKMYVKKNIWRRQALQPGQNSSRLCLHITSIVETVAFITLLSKRCVLYKPYSLTKKKNEGSLFGK